MLYLNYFDRQVNLAYFSFPSWQTWGVLSVFMVYIYLLNILKALTDSHKTLFGLFMVRYLHTVQFPITVYTNEKIAGSIPDGVIGTFL